MAIIKRSGAPKRSTIGEIGDIYIDVDIGKSYKLVGIYYNSVTKPNYLSVFYDWRLVKTEQSIDGLPEVDEKDEGKVLGVQNGVWKVIESSGSSGKSKLVVVELPTDNWIGSGLSYYQVMETQVVSVDSLVDIRPTPEQLQELLTSEISLTIVNESGTLKAFAIGGKPLTDLTLQVVVSKVII